MLCCVFLPKGEDGIAEGDLLLEEQIAGVDRSKDARNTERVRPLADPKGMTAEQLARRNLTHLPCHPACPFCVAGKRNNTPHRHPTTERTIRLLHSDYGFRRDSLADDTLPFSGCMLSPGNSIGQFLLMSKDQNPSWLAS